MGWIGHRWLENERNQEWRLHFQAWTDGSMTPFGENGKLCRNRGDGVQREPMGIRSFDLNVWHGKCSLGIQVLISSVYIKFESADNWLRSQCEKEKKNCVIVISMALNTHKVNRSPGWCWVFLKQGRAWDWDLAFLGVEKEEELVTDAERPMKQREAERVARPVC